MFIVLQEFIYQKLNVFKISDNVTGIYYQVPANSKFPYIYIGEFHSKDRSTKNQNIEEIHFKINIYLRDKSLKSMLELMQNIKNKIIKKEIIVYFIDEKIGLHSDGITHQISMSFKAILGKLNDL